jgi:hypothetical protein
MGRYHGIMANIAKHTINEQASQMVPRDSQLWQTAPVIIAENAMKDVLNEEMAKAFACRTGQPLHWYYTVDIHSKKTNIESGDL